MSRLRRHGALVLAAIVAGLAVAAALTWLTPRTYGSSVRLFVTAAHPTDTASAYEGNLFTQQRVASYAALLTGTQLAGQVVDDLQLPLTPQAVAGEVRVATAPDTVTLDVSVTDASPERAQAIAAALARRFRDTVTVLETPDGAPSSTIAVRTILAATYDPTPLGPDTTGNLWRGAAIGLVVGLALAWASARLDSRVRTDEDVRAATGTGLVGRAPTDRSLGRAHVVTALPTRSPSVDAFLATGVALQASDAGPRPAVLVVAGCLPGDGASTVAVNVAVSLARLGDRVLLVDADLRRPRAARRLGLSDEPGLTDVLVGTVGLERAIQTWDDGPLAVLAAGAADPNPGDLLGSDRMGALLGELRRGYDVVVVDAPPVLSLVDAGLVGGLAGGCLLVARHGRTRRDQLAEAAARLAAVHAPLLGVVLDRLPRGTAMRRAGAGATPPGVARVGAHSTAAALVRAVPAGSTPQLPRSAGGSAG